MNAAEVAVRLGARRVGREWRCDCPSCGYHAAFSVQGGVHQRARVSCFGCNDRDGITSALLAITAGAWTPPERQKPETEAQMRAEKQKRARRLWEHGTTALNSIVGVYLSVRGLAGLEQSAALRFGPSIGHPQGGPKLPAMLAEIVDAAGEMTGLHRTYLRPDGAGKAAVEPAKASLGVVWGGAIRLHPHDSARPLVIGEGIETAASAGILLQAPAWAAVSAGNLGGGVVLPEEVRDVIIAADDDQEGERRAQQAAWRWNREGRSARIARPRAGDWNDVLLEELR